MRFSAQLTNPFCTFLKFDFREQIPENKTDRQTKKIKKRRLKYESHRILK